MDVRKLRKSSKDAKTKNQSIEKRKEGFDLAEFSKDARKRQEEKAKKLQEERERIEAANETMQRDNELPWIEQTDNRSAEKPAQKTQTQVEQSSVKIPNLFQQLDDKRETETRSAFKDVKGILSGESELDKYFSERKTRIDIANEEVERRYGPQLREKKKAMDDFFNRNKDPRMGNTIVASAPRQEYMNLKNDYEATKQEADQLRKEIITFGDVNTHVAGQLAELGINTKLKDLAVKQEQAAEAYQTYYKNPLRKEGDNLSRVLAQRQLDAESEYNQYKAKLDRLANYVSTFGLPKDPEQLPKDIKDLLKTFPDFILNAPDKLPEDLIHQYAKYAYDQIQAEKKHKASGGSQNNIDQDYAEQLLEDQQMRKQMYIDAQGVRPEHWGTQKYGKEIRAINSTVKALEKALTYKKISDDIQKASGVIDKYGIYTSPIAIAAGHAGLAPYITDAEKFAMRIAKGTWDKISDFDTWTGLNSLDNLVRLNKINDKLKENKSLTREEQDLLNATAVDDILHSKYADYESDTAYKWGQISGESVPFMVDFILTNGWKAAIDAGVKTGSKYTLSAIKNGLQKYGKEQLSFWAKRKLVTTKSAVDRLLGDATYALAVGNTIQLPRTAKNIVDIHLGNVDYSISGSGEVVGTGFKEGEDWGKALYLGEGRQFVENFTEQMGEWGIGKFLFSPLTKIPKVGNYLGKVGEFAQRLSPREYGKFIRDLTEKAQIGGYFGEVAEEYYGIPLNHMLGISEAVNEDGTPKTFLEDLLDPEQAKDILGGIGVSMLTMGMIGAGNYYYHRNKFGKARTMAQLALGEDFDKVEDAILDADYTNVAGVAGHLITTAKNKTQANAIRDYFTALMGYRGASITQQKKLEEVHQNRFSKGSREAAYKEGYDLYDEVARQDYENAHKIAKQNLMQMLNVTEDELDDTDLQDYAQRILTDYEESDDKENEQAEHTARAALAYLNIESVLQGAKQRQYDNLKMQIEDATRFILRELADADGNVVTAKIKDAGEKDEGVYIVRGDITKDKKVLVYDRNTGITQMMDTDKIDKESVEAHDVQEVILSNNLSIAQKNQKYELENQNKLGLRVGDKHVMEDGKVLTILGPSRDGGMLYQIAEPGSDTGVIQQQPNINSFNEFIKNIQEGKARQIYEGHLEDLDTTPKQPVEEEEPAVNITQVIADETKNSKPSAFVPVTQGTTTTAYAEGQTKKDAQNNHKLGKKLADYAKSAKSFSEFLNAIKDKESVVIEAKYIQRLRRMFNAFKKGNITKNMFGLLFVPNELRELLNTQKWGKRFEDMVLDDDGNIIKASKPGTTSPAETALRAKIEADKSRVLEDQTTAHDYFILDETGKRRMYSRVHSAIEPQKKPDALTIKRQAEYKAELQEAFGKGLTEFKRVARKQTNGLVKIDQYLSYIEENPNEAQDVIEAISNLAATATTPKLKPQYEGKLIFIQDGGGKSTIKKFNKDVVDSDDLFKQIAPNGLYAIPEEQREKALQDYAQAIRDEVAKGKTVLTGNIALLQEADVVIYNSSAENTVTRTSATDRENPFSDKKRAEKQGTAIKEYVEQNPNVESYQLNDDQFASDVLTYTKNKPALELGTLVDALFREIVQKGEINYDSYVTPEGYPISHYMNRSVFDSFVQQMKDQVEFYNGLGWTLIAEPIYLYNTVWDEQQKRNVRVAGVTDVIAIDNDGIPHIIDFKTSQYDFDDSSYDKTFNGYNRSSKAQHSMQLSMYSLLSSLQLNWTLPSIEVLGIKMSYDTDLQIHEISINARKELTYSNDIFNRFTKPATSITEDLIKKCKTVANALQQEAFVPKIGEGASQQTKQLLETFANDVKTWLNTFNSDKLVDGDYTHLLQQYSELFERRFAVIKALEQDETEYLHEQAQNQEDATLAAKNAPLVNEDETIDSQLSEEEIHAANLRAAFEANMSFLAEQFNLFRQKGWDVQPADIPEDVRRDIDKVLSNLNEILKELPISSEEMQNFFAAKAWLSKNLGITGGNSSPITPKIKTLGDIPSWQKINTTRKADTENAVSITDPNVMLSSVSAKPDFMNKATFTFTKDGKILYLIIKYGSHTFTPIRVFTGRTPKGDAFYHRIINSIVRNANKDVHPTKIRRTYGTYKKSKNKTTLADKKLISTKRGEKIPYIYDIEFSPNPPYKFGVIRINQGADGIYQTVVTVPGQAKDSKQVVYVYSNSNENRPKAGTIVYMHELEYDEVSGSKPQVPIVIDSAKLTEGDARLIAGILKGEYVGDQNPATIEDILKCTFVENGEEKALTCREVLSYLIPYGNDKASGKPIVHLEYDLNDRHIVHVVGRIAGSNSPITEVSDVAFNLSNEAEVEKFVSFLQQNVTRHIDIREFARKRLGDDPRIRNKVSGGKQLKFGDSTIMFDQSDVQDLSNPSDNSGLSGFAWYLKRGFLQTDFDGMEAPLFEFPSDCDGEISKENETQQTPDIQNTDGNSIDQVVEATEEIDPDAFILQMGGKKDYSIDQEVARKRLRRILGKFMDFDKLFVDSLEKLLNAPAASVGACTSTAIYLTARAEAGDEFHEAFHWVAELLFPEIFRNKVYEEYRKAKDLDSDVSEKEIREAIADDFKYYLNNIPTFKLSGGVKEFFSYMNRWGEHIRQIGSWKLFMLYNLVNFGAFRFLKPRPANIRRLNEIGALYRREQPKVEGVVNLYQYKELVNTLALFFMNPEGVKTDWHGMHIEDIKIDKEHLLANKYYQQALSSKLLGPKTIQLLKNAAENFDEIAPDVAAYIQQFSTDYKTVWDEQNAASQQGVDTHNQQDETPTTSEEDIAESQLDQHTKASYEFNPFTRTTQKVRWFFAGIANCKYRLGQNGKAVQKAVRNTIGLPQLMNPADVYALVLNTIRDVRSPEDILEQLQENGKYDPVFDTLAKRFEKLYNSAYLSDNPNADDEALISQIFGALSQTKNTFDTVKSRSYSKNPDKTWTNTFTLLFGDESHTSREFTRNWSQNFAGGGCRYITKDRDGNYRMANNAKGEPYKPTIFIKFWERFGSMTNENGQELGYRYLFSPIPNKKPVVIRGRELNIDNPADIQFIKDNVIQMLNQVGIAFTGDMLDYMLQHKFGDTGKVGLEKFFNDSDETNIMTLCYTLTGLLERTFDEKGKPVGYKLNKEKFTNLDHIYDNNGFVKELAKWKYEYQHATNQLMVLATGNNKFYVMSENNLITDRLIELQDDAEFLAALESDDYVVSLRKENGQNPTDLNPGKLIGSLLVKHAHSKNPQRLKFHTLVGFKTDQRGDAGIDYSKINDREDYISKMEILVAGGILFPTMSDKKTFGAIFGCELPGLHYEQVRNSKRSDVIGTIPKEIQYTADGTTILPMDNAVLDQIVEYWETEFNSVQAYLNSDRKDKVDNYDVGRTVKTKTGKHTIRQGGRFNTALGVYENGTYVSFNRTIDENGEYVSEEDCLNIAREKFFSKSTEEKRNMIQELLSRQLEKELDYLTEIGLLRRVSETDGILSFQNIGLDQGIIDAIASKMTGVPTQTSQALAVAIFVNDILCKNEMSSQEVSRVFSGNTAYFGNKYDTDGRLIDITTDWHKRLGGIVSTGQKNNLTLPGMPEYYSCAEVDDYMMVPENIKELETLMYESELRDAYHIKLLKDAGIWFGETSEEKKAKLAEIYEKVNSDKTEDIEAALGEDLVKIVKDKASGKSGSFKEKGGVNVTDGAAYVSDKMCENLLRQVGAWSEEIKTAFKILRGEEVDGKIYGPNDIVAQANAYQKVVTTVIGTQKYTAYGFRFQEGKSVPYYNKMAIFPVFKCMATGKMAKIYKAMQDQEIDMMMMKSAVKTGSQNSKPINWDEWHSEEGDNKPDFNDPENGFKFNKYYQKYTYLRKQFNTDPKEKELMKMGTQMTKVALSTLRPGRTYTVGIKEYTADEMLDNIMGCLNNLSDKGFETLKEKLFKEDDELDIEKFSNFLQQELSKRGANLEMLNATSIVKENETDAEGNPIYNMELPLDAMPNMNWIQSIIASVVNDETINANIQGKAFYQRSVWGMEGSTQVLNDENLPKSINNGNKLKMINEHGSMDCVLSIDFFTDVLKQAGLEKASFEKQRQWLLDNGIIGGAEFDEAGNITKTGASTNMVGYRIPTQAISSIHALRCVDVLPVVRDTVILPQEFTTITGSDFDIDKLYISSIQYKVKNGRLVSFETDSAQYVKNQLIRNYISILSDSKNAAHMLHAPIDKDTEALKDIVEELGLGSSTDEIMPFESFSLRRQSYTKTQFIAGKFGIGPFALNNNSHILTMMYKVGFKTDGGVLDKLGMTSLHEVDDRYGKSILSWLSGLINAHVDVAKDPYITRLGVNSYTYNLVNLMIRVGFGRDTFYFTSQPIMRKFSFAHNVASGVYMQNKSQSKSSRIREEIERVWKEEIENGLESAYETFDAAHDAWIKHFSDEYKVRPSEAKTAILTKDGCDILRQIAKKKLKNINDDHSTYKLQITRKAQKSDGQVYEYTKTIECSAFDIQMLVAEANEDLNGQQNSYAQALADIVKYAKIDTEKQGNTVIQQRMYLEKYQEIFMRHEGSGSRFEEFGLTNMAMNSFIHKKTINATNMFLDIISGVSIESTPAFYGQVKQILRAINKENTGDEKIVSDVVKALKAKIKSEYFFRPGGYCDTHKIDAKSLVVGDNTIYDRLIQLQSKILSEGEDENSRLALPGGIPKNYLLRTLVTGATYANDYKDQFENTQKDTYEGAKFVKILNFLSDDSIDQDLFISAWEELLNDNEFPEGQAFARDLIVYAMMTSADNGGRFDLFKYVPNSWKTNELQNEESEKFEDSYAYFIYQKLQEYKSRDNIALSDEQIDDIVLNNWHNEGLVPTISGNKYVMIKTQGVTGVPLVLAAIEYTSKGNIRRTRRVEQGCPRFIKIARGAKEDATNTASGQRRCVVYQHVDNGAYRSSGGAILEYPIYQIVDPRGVRFYGGETVYSYGRDDSVINEAYNFFRERLIKLFNGKNTEGLVSLLRRIKDGIPFLRVVYEYMSHGHDTEFVDFSKLVDDYQPGHNVDDRYWENEDQDQYDEQDELDAFDEWLQNDAKEYQDFVQRVAQTNKNFDVSTAEFYSGGARGSDSEWGIQARALGIKVKDYTVEDLDALPQEWQDKLYKEYLGVIEELGYNEASDPYKKKLLIRDMMQADKADAIFAISKVSGGEVDGGTIYAVTRGWQRSIPVYVFDQSTSTWYDYDTKDEIPDPVLTPHAAVIGTREIKESGKEAISRILSATVNGTVNPAPNTYAPGTQSQSNISVQQNNNTFNDDNEYPDDAMKHCKGGD